MQEIRGGEGLCYHLGELLELERPLEGGGVVEAPAEHGTELHLGEGGGSLSAPFLVEGMATTEGSPARIPPPEARPK